MYKRLKAPLDAQIEVTGLCTHLCRHCYNFWREKTDGVPTIKKTPSSLSQKDAIAIVQKLSTAEVFNITITGGEPLLNIGTCLSCIESARSMNMRIGMNSNLIPLTLDMAEALKRAGLNQILTSILGPTPEIHDKISQKNGSFKMLLKKARIAQEAGIKISVNMVVSKLNLDAIKATAEVVAGLGIKNFMATKAGCPGNCSDFSDLALSDEQLVQFLNDLCWVKKNLGMNVDTLEPIPHCGMLGVENLELFTTRKCYAGITTMTVSYDGSVRPCSHFDMSYGNLLMEDLSVIWSKMDSWSHGFQFPDECKKCPMFPSCGSGCRMEAKTRMGILNSADPYTRMDHVKKVAEIIQSLQKQIAVPLPKRFKTVKFRTRKETFGGIIALDGNRRILLDHRGLSVINQLRPDTVYGLPINIDWKGLDPGDFITGLIQKKVLLCV